MNGTPDNDAALAELDQVLARLGAEVEKRARPVERPAIAAAEAPAEGATQDRGELAAKAAAIYAGRRKREQIFGVPAIFADPAWDIMLDLFVANAKGRSISVSCSTVAAAVAPTTALRWIQTLIDYDLLKRVPDPVDRRRCFLQLSERGFDLVARAVAVA